MRFGQKKFTSYSEAVRQFCLKIHYHSPAAYECLRETFNNNLPHIRTILKWYSSIGSSPGLSTPSFDILAEKVKSYQDCGKQLYVSLISDEMAIKQKLQWDAVLNKFMGFATFASEKNIEKYAEQNSLPLAKQVLVFMVVGENFKLAVAFFYLNGLSSEDRAVLTKEVIKRINQTGAKIIALTSDGFAGNIATARILGADFSQGKPFFADPDDPTRRIFIMWDPPHMLKLARNCFGSKKLYHIGRPIEWRYIEDLYKLQQDHVIRYGNKLKYKHMDWKNQKMNVGIATQTLSNSVANGLQQAHDDGIMGFEGYEATAEYIRLNNNLFDIMNVKKQNDVNANNSKEIYSGKYKKPLSPSTKEEYFEYFKYAKEYFKELVLQEDEGENGSTSVKSVFDSRSHTPFFGHLNNMISLEKIYEDYVESGILNEIYTFQFSQDHLETWFGCVRRQGGSSDNPTPVEFAAAFRKLLVCNGIVCSKYSNAIDRATKILTVSSGTKQNLGEMDLRCGRSVEIDFDYNCAISKELDPFVQHNYALLASAIEKKKVSFISKRIRSSCQECLNVFVENEVISDDLIDSQNETSSKNKWIFSCKDTFDIVNVCHEIVKELSEKQQVMEPITPESSLKTIFDNL